MEIEPRGVIFLITNSEQEVLMQLRDDDCSSYPNRWCFPGGESENEESYEGTLLREAEEEFKLKLNKEDCELILKRLGNQNYVYLCKLPENQTPILNEGADMKWMKMDEIKKIKLGFEQDDIFVLLEEKLDV